jgi:hypothetical protein
LKNFDKRATIARNNHDERIGAHDAKGDPKLQMFNEETSHDGFGYAVFEQFP